MLSEAGGVGFDEASANKAMTPQEMDRSMTSLVAEIEPSIEKRTKKVKYGYDPVRGEKVRLEKPKKWKESKSARKERRAQEFWSNM